MSDIDEYVVSPNDNEVSTPKEKSKRKNKKQKDVLEVIDHELIRKRDILASVALLDGLKRYVGENISAAQIRNMEKEKLETYFTLYQEKAGQEVTNEMMSSLIEIAVKGLSFVVEIDNEEDLKNDLINNKQLRRTIGRQAAGITEKYGDAVAILRVLFTMGKHISFSSPTTDAGSASTTLAHASTPTTDASTTLAPASTPTTDASTMLAQC